MTDRPFAEFAGRVAASFGVHMHEGAPPTSNADLTTIGESGVVGGGGQFEVYVYTKAVTQDLTVKLLGRMKGHAGTGAVIGDWIQVGTDIVATAGADGTISRFQASDNIGAFNEFKLQWSAPSTGGATTQVGIALV